MEERHRLRATGWCSVIAALAGTGCVVVPLEPKPPIPQAIAAHRQGVRSLEFSRDGQLLASASRDGSAILWDVASQKPVGAPLVAGRKGVRTLTLSPDAATVAVGNEDGSVWLRDARLPPSSGTALPGRQRGAVTSLAFSPDGRSLASFSTDGSVILWDVEARAELDRLARSGKGVGRVLFSPDGRIIAVATSDEIAFFDASTRRLLGSPLKTKGGLGGLAFSADGRLLARTGDRFSLYNVEERRCVWGSAPGCVVDDGRLTSRAGVAFDTEGRFLAVGDTFVGAGNVEVWRVERSGPLAAPEGPIATLRGHGGKRIGGVGLGMGGLAADASVWTYIHAVSFSPDGRILATGGDDGAIILWDVPTWAPIARKAP